MTLGTNLVQTNHNAFQANYFFSHDDRRILQEFPTESERKQTTSTNDSFLWNWAIKYEFYRIHIGYTQSKE